MTFLYSLSIFFYDVFIRLAALFSPKAKLFVQGRENWIPELQNSILESEEYVWMHCASLGEFEQGRPLIEKIKTEYPGIKIILTFFSPSGYEVRKDYKGADVVMYLPLDTRFNAEFFISIVKPKATFFIKYEFWHYYIDVLHRLDIPLFLVSGIFRKNQIHFKFYGNFFQKSLRKFAHHFVQDQNSKDLLTEIGINEVGVSGDTRFDRVLETLSENKQYVEVENFINGNKCIVYGSSWPEDEVVYLSSLNRDDGVKHIIAPHEINETKLNLLENKIAKSIIRFSSIDKETNVSEYDVLIIDSIGMLAYIYQYADIAYVGGAFGKGLHNILEAATFGKPIIFGPNYMKFKEAKDLIVLKGAFMVVDKKQYDNVFYALLNEEAERIDAGEACRKYTVNNQGATKEVMKYLKENSVL